jgi:hypothetical protein
MAKGERAARQIVAQAIQVTGSCELDRVVEYMVRYYWDKVQLREKARNGQAATEVFKAIERIGFETTRDVQRVIDELMQRGRLAG